MKTLNNYINEWRANTNTVSSIKKPQYFIYEIHKLQQIKILYIFVVQLPVLQKKVHL